ncbi:FtsX-like permease family protein [Anatilimnocola aggregata]|uniref:FtsX-like permease family protein n=1 Tax=Anatilimnocola aggregata TaxID=2528021 RepID=A0A517Y9S4_9BACT|nr:ABC transporter permease [Anatilimnocola aggregata]QDU26941.1 FtsX-like permease family protein [Anatilimnocola aggregata]
MKFLLLMFKNVRRNKLRSLLTAGATVMLVLVITLVWSILDFLNKATTEKEKDLKAIVTERWQIPSRMPFAYASQLEEGGARNPGDIKPADSMTWQFYGGSLDPKQMTRDNILFAFALEPKKLETMMDDLDKLEGQEKEEFHQAVLRLEENQQGLILGRDRLKGLNKKIGDRIKLYGLNFKEIDLEFEIVGQFPAGAGRYDQSAAMNRKYLNNAIDAYPRTHAGKQHPQADRSLALFWLRVNNKQEFQKIAEQISTSPAFTNPAVKCETAASGVANFLDSYRDIFWGMRFLLTPAAIISLCVVSANAIGISVRERRQELAVMKVLGFRPRQILLLVLGESMILGLLAGLFGSWGAYFLINDYFGGFALPIAFFGKFFISSGALWWGPAIGLLAGFVGSVWPAWSACSVKVTDVFSKVA